MAGYSARQSSFTTGDTITAAHSNDEFNQVLAAFHATTGHSHDGTSGEGGPVSTLRDADSNNKILVDTTNNHLEFYVEVSSSATQQLRIQDGAIVPITDNDIDLGTSSLEFKDAYFDGTVTSDAFAGPLTGDVTGNVSGTAATVTTAAQTNITSLGTLTTLTVDNVIINGTTIGHTSDTDLITVADGVATVAGEVSMTTLDIGGTNVTSTAAELNIIDGGTSATSTTVADADRVVLNDNGTMVQVAVTDLAAYFDDEITAMPNLVTTAATTVGALNSGSITSGFGTIDTGSSTITTTGLITGGSLDIDDVLINGTTIGHTDDTDLITLADGVATVAGEISVTTLDIGGTNVTATAAEINLIDGGTARGTTAVADADGILHNDGGTMRMTSAATFKTYFTSGVSSAADDLTVGDAAVNITTSSGDITIDAAANDSDIIFKGTDNSSDITMLTLDGSEAGAATFNNKIIATELDISGDVDIDGTLEADAITIDGATLAETISDTVGAMVGSNTETGITVTYQDGDNTLDFALGAAQTTITSLLATDIKIGEDDQTKIDFETADEIHFYAANVEQVYLGDNIFGPQADSDVDLGSSSVRWKDAYIDTITTTGAITSGAGVVIADAGNIGSASDTDAIAIASNGVVTFSQTPVLSGASISAGTTPLTALDIDGGTDIGADLADADLFIVDDAAGGTNRKVAASRIKTYVGGGTSWQAVKTGNFTAAAGQGVFCNTTSSAFTITLPAGTIGDEVSIVDYAGTFDSNALTVAANGSEKIFGSTDDLTVSTERAAFTLVFTDSTQGWLFKND